MGSDVEVTEADRQKAMQIMALDPLTYDGLVRAAQVDYANPDDRDALELVDAIAQALAAERAKAQAPFLVLADELDASAPPTTWLVLRRRGRPGAWVKAAQVIDRIRRAAEEG